MTGCCRMRPTASALGVIAIVSVMITATSSEAGNGAVETSINHPVVDEEDQRVRGDEATANGTVADDPVTLHDPTDEAPIASSKPTQSPLEKPANVSSEEIIVESLQRDQSDLLVSVAVAVNDEVDGDPSESRSGERESGGRSRGGVQQASKDFVASTRPNRVEVASSVVDQLDGVQAEDEGLSNVVERGESNVDKWRRGGGSFTTASVRETISTEVARPIERKNVEDIRAISFQVPAVVEGVEEAVDRQGNEQARKDHSRPVNNLLLAGGKSTKAFYEIKPSIKTEMEGDQVSPTIATQRPLHGRKFVLPSVDSAFGKFGPYFEDGDQEMNITARIGSTMLLDCKIGMLGNKEVTWVQQPSKDLFRLLTVGRIPYSVDQRISLSFRYPSNWRLQIQYANPRDSGLYKCQVSTHPPLVKTINVIVTAPELTITDDSGRAVSKERHLKAGSALKLRCEARDVIESLKESVIWTRGDETLTEDVSENRTTEISAGKEVLVIVSTLIVERASPRHAGNYSCVVRGPTIPEKAKTTIAVHVLNGELPAAVHDGNGVSRAFLNLWLIHLTMSYVFSR
ncbi:uncharacterized protein LOC100577522 [Apis mellifera]|uniref:Uncharacterized protein LOC100577522 n=1 Tax=Apis mellifera TaxID=7460 RepID=A0A7M7IJQ3_APIME|nr:uncharacterized protein LOC100577522 [Apis mellifera]XP_016772842.1 uncharacterized protein LOC100577522 [Apis mellifera]XP_016772846.1 uncharacterized protein LOC100577522 [Apis mellifera]XP_026295907.1 uncharacterized protein LOC100577522 [Apis mellifera]XP_026295911.1 uncharacterized protein LOC100577522 [Apis mellifera]XP_026295914.1 uncharacterized protein LOC100577522 [Apis mellifera]|eukprot:XP_016772841.1 uncharacterized protein LOC100577522 [Apis mellifera]